MGIIQLNHVTCRAQERIILDDIHMSLTQNRTAIIGANGSGKSTFIRLLNGLILPDEGEIWVGEYKTESRDIHKIRKNIGFMFQNPEHQVIWPQVKEDLTFSLKAHHYPKESHNQRIDDILARLNISYLKEALIHELSGGERQLVALAGLLITEPSWLIFDEPSAMLDLYNKLNIQHIIHNLKQKVVIITHDLDWASQFDEIIWLNEGRIIKQGGMEVVELYKQYTQEKVAKNAL